MRFSKRFEAGELVSSMPSGSLAFVRDVGHPGSSESARENHLLAEVS
ncbi:hypothetical protein [Halostagnicola sp. A-GB9-2]|nr:hypothetical protein [Halostagnicola sp. A-GB9-2]MDJ1434136.1 hypothetical protein [Halostagnicola sp. A-GB9-2]